MTWFVAPEKFGCALLLYDCVERLGRSHGRHTALLFGCSDRIRVPSFSPLTVWLQSSQIDDRIPFFLRDGGTMSKELEGAELAMLWALSSPK